jgi:hypothetical protein
MRLGMGGRLVLDVGKLRIHMNGGSWSRFVFKIREIINGISTSYFVFACRAVYFLVR